MSRWFRFEDDEINNPAALRLSDKAHRAWIGLLCVASKHDGILPPQEDCALMLRLPVERLAEAIVTLVGAGLLDRDEPWDDYGRATTGKPYPRNRRGFWHFPTKFPPFHALTGRTA
jgi:hypothetical protein